MDDDALLKFAAEFREGILDGAPSALMCFAVCAPLSTLLQIHGVDNEVASGDLGWINHFWLVLSDGRVLDPTADQFNGCDGVPPMPPIYLGAATAIHPVSPTKMTPTHSWTGAKLKRKQHRNSGAPRLLARVCLASRRGAEAQ